ncbi:recombination regulator RecX [Bordetella bronchialis]|uniref:Regulatory protein RecX n=1 Tax=Bordetella bronchialis TaxID=463025 RepID=A0A193FVX2_9BORD|nr:recombination regulator RecX [Bordetella bronchialis]ANN66419.1 recombination regulator RecX [Bordetella bronchialis]ANN71498.1 recombination regulator RecX [Bordetella bronchialis]
MISGRRGTGPATRPAKDAQDDAFGHGERGGEKRGPSLKARAVGYLSRREYARSELARKLAPHADDPAVLDALLDDLEREGWLSTRRFAESLVHRRAERQGAARIVQELRQHGVDESQIGELRDTLRATEYDRAVAVWNKRYGERPTDRAAYAKQARFLASRGFAHDVIRRVLGDDGED